MKNNITILFLFIIALFSCQDKENPPTESEKCEEYLNFKQIGEQSNNFISGTIGNNSFYYGVQNTRFKIYSFGGNFSSGSGIQRSEFVFGLRDTLSGINVNDVREPNFNFLFSFIAKEELPHYEILQKYLKVGDLPMEIEQSSNPFGMSIRIEPDCGYLYAQGGGSTIWRSNVGNQQNSYIRCTSVSTKDLGSSIEYSLGLSFDINIYKDNFGNALWNNIKNGAAQMTFTIDK